MAGLLAHEMGHIVAHHAATQTSVAFRKVLGVTQVGDRDDVFAKWNQLMSNYRRVSGSYDKFIELEEREQVQADTIALYLMTRAGYSPQAFETFFDRLAETKGNTGGFWSEFFRDNYSRLQAPAPNHQEHAGHAPSVHQRRRR